MLVHMFPDADIPVVQLSVDGVLDEIGLYELGWKLAALLISTFNEDGSVDVMNAAWGTMLNRDMVALNLTETHKTVEMG